MERHGLGSWFHSVLLSHLSAGVFLGLVMRQYDGTGGKKMGEEEEEEMWTRYTSQGD